MENIQKVMQSFRTKLTFMFLLFWTIPNYSLLHNNQLGFLLENTHQNKYNIYGIFALKSAMETILTGMCAMKLTLIRFRWF